MDPFNETGGTSFRIEKDTDNMKITAGSDVGSFSTTQTPNVTSYPMFVYPNASVGERFSTTQTPSVTSYPTFVFPNASVGESFSTTQTPNVTSYPMFVYPKTISFIIVSAAFFIAITTVVGNLLVLLAFYLERSLRQKYANYLVVSMAVSDLLLGAIGPVPVATSLVIDYWPFGVFYCRVWDTCTISLAMTTQTHAFALSVERYMSVRYPNKHRAWETKCMMVAIIFFIWIITNGTGIFLYVFLTDESNLYLARPQCDLRIPKLYRTIVYTLTFFLRLLIMGYIYFYLYTVAQKLNKEIMQRKSKMEVVASSAIDSTSNAVDVMSFREAHTVNQNSSNHLSEGARDNHGRLFRPANRISLLGKADFRSKNYNQLNSCFNEKDGKIHLGDNKSSLKAHDESEDYLGWKRSHLHLERKHIMTLMDISHKNKNSNSTTKFKRTSQPDRQSGPLVSVNKLNASESVPKLHPEQTARPDVQQPQRGSTPKTAKVSRTYSNKILRTGSHTNAPTGQPVSTVTSGEKRHSSDDEEAGQRMKKALKTVVILLSSNIVSYGPFATWSLFTTFSAVHWPISLLHFLMAFVYINGMVNPVVYVLVNPLFRATLKRMSLCRCHKN